MKKKCLDLSQEHRPLSCLDSVCFTLSCLGAWKVSSGGKLVMDFLKKQYSSLFFYKHENIFETIIYCKMCIVWLIKYKHCDQCSVKATQQMFAEYFVGKALGKLRQDSGRLL